MRSVYKLGILAWILTGLLPAVCGSAEKPELSLQKLDVIAPEDLKASDLPPGQQDTILPSNLFGFRNGYFHPFLSLTGKYSDNIFRDKEDTIGDFSTVLSPGLWLALPRSDEIILTVSSSTAQPGGLSMFLEKPESFNRYQFYAFYGADLERFLDHTERNNTKQTANGFFQYNLRGGLSFNVYDKWIDSEDPLRFRDILAYDRFESNLLGLIVQYDVTDSLNLRVDLNNFLLTYDEDYNKFKDRTDNAVSFYGFYNYSPKTSLFTEYQFINVDLKENASPDSTQHSLNLGTIWKPTDSTALTSKVGVTYKDFDDPDADSVSRVGIELQARHDFTSKTNLTLFGAQKLNETKVLGTDYQEMKTLSGTFNHQFTQKISGTLTLGITENDYRSNSNAGADRDDIVYDFEPGLQYMFKRWLMLRGWYAYTQRDSSDDIFDYTENAFYLGLSGGM